MRYLVQMLLWPSLWSIAPCTADRPITADVSTVTSSPDSTLVEEDFTAKEIPRNFFNPWVFYQQKDITFSDENDTLAILQRLFPGNVVKNPYSDDPPMMVGWICTRCPKTHLDYNGLHESEQIKFDFPYEEYNYTEIIKIQAVTPKQKVIWFSTRQTPDVGSIESGGVLSGAIVERDTGLWHLRRFSPVIDYEGLWDRALAPDTAVVMNKRLVFPLEQPYHAGPPVEDWSPSWSDFKLYGEQASGITLLLTVKDYVCSSENSGLKTPAWSSTWQFEPCSRGLCPLTILTQGRFERREDILSTLKLLNLPTQLKQAVRQREAFDFTLTRRFVYRKGRYVAVGETLAIK